MPCIKFFTNINSFNLHNNPNPECPVGKNIKNTLDEKFYQIQKVMEDKMKSISLKDIVDDII